MRVWLAAAFSAVSCTLALAQVTVTPQDLVGQDGQPEAVDVETAYYKARFNLLETGSASSLIYKPLNHELRAEAYYANPCTLFRDWVRMADPDPLTGFTRAIGPETKDATRLAASYRVLKQTPDEVVIQFETKYPRRPDMEWLEKILCRRTLTLRNDSPAIRIESTVVNTDVEQHSVLFDLYEGLNLGRVRTAVCMPGAEGKLVGIDRADEMSSQFLYNPEPGGDWIGGVNEDGLGGAFSLDWPDIDSMEVSMFKTVGSVYVVNMRRRTVPPAGEINFKYTFMPFTGFGALDGMRDDLAGGVMVGNKVVFPADVAQTELKPGTALPLNLFFASGSRRDVLLRVRCVRMENQQVVLNDGPVPLRLRPAETMKTEATLSLPPLLDGLYVLTVTLEDGAGAVLLRMEKGLEVGKTKLVYSATLPPGEKRGSRDAAFNLGPAPMNPQFTTIDPSFRTQADCVIRNTRRPVRAFFAVPADSTLGHVREIAQRSTETYEYFAIGKVQTPPDTLNFRDVNEFRKRFRAGSAEVLVSLALDWQVGFDRKLIAEILDRVREGMGLVIAVRDLKKQPDLDSALAEAQEIKDSPLPPAAVMAPAVKLYQLGKGRVAVVLCNWSNYRDGGEQALGAWTSLNIEGQSSFVGEFKWRGFEYSYVRLAQLIEWTARKEPAVRITAVRLDGDTAVISIQNDGPALADLTLRAQVRNRRWELPASGEEAVEVKGGASERRIKLSRAPAGGTQAIEVRISDRDAQCVAFASFGARVPEAVTVKITPQPEYQPAEKPGKCAVELAGADDVRLAFSLTDRFGRLVFKSEQPVQWQEGKAQVEFDLGTVHPVTIYHEALAQVFSGDRLVNEATADLYLVPLKPDYTDRFILGVADSPERKALHLQAILATTRGLGFSMHSNSYHDQTTYATGGTMSAMVSVSPRTRFARARDAAKLDDKNLIMTPPLLPSADDLQAFKERWQESVKKAFTRGVRLINIDDERRMSGDFDFSPQTLAGFRKWIRTRYRDVAELNATWGTTFADFDSVMPKRRSDLGESPNLAPWLEFRLFIGNVLGEYYMKRPAEWAAEISPELSVAEMGIYEPSSVWPVDWSRYARCYRFSERYGETQGALEDLLRCFGDGLRAGPWQGYGMTKISDGRRIAVWASLLNGGNFAWFWAMNDNGYWNYGVCTSDQRPTAGYAALAADEFPDLTGGIDRMIIASAFTQDGIATGYSWPSWVADARALGATAKLIIQELGFQHNYVNMEDVATGRLEKDGYRLLLLEDASCLAREQIDGVRHFVENGGTLLAVGRCGWRDAHGAPYAQGSPLDDLLGIDQRKAKPLGRALMTLNPNRPLRITVQSSDVHARDAQILEFADLADQFVPVLTVRSVGKGRVYWLNSTLNGHRAVFTGGVAQEQSIALGGPEAIRQSHWLVFDQVVRAAGIEPRCRLLQGDRPLFDSETWYYQTPSKRSLLVAHHLARDVQEPITVQLARSGHIYELRTHKDYGVGNRIEETFPRGVMRLFAILEYGVTGVTVAVDRPIVRPGERVTVSCAVETDGAPADLHGLRFSVLDPQGKELPAYNSTLLARDGRAQLVIPLALNQPVGRHTVRVMDVVSGKMAVAKLEVLAQ